MGFPKIRVPFLGVPIIRTSILGSILGFLYLGKLPHLGFASKVKIPGLCAQFLGYIGFEVVLQRTHSASMRTVIDNLDTCLLHAA